MKNLLESRVRTVLSLAGMAAIAMGPTTAHGQQGRLYVATDVGVYVGPNPGGHVRVFSGVDGGAWSPAAGEFDMVASSGGWYAASGGNFLMGDGSVRFISYSVSPTTWGSAPRPIEVWDGAFRSETAEPRLVRMEARPSEMSVYLSPSAPPVPVVPTGSVRFVLSNPVAFGAAGLGLAAPGEGTAMDAGPERVLASATGPEPILIGLLVPAVQKVREAAARSAGHFTITFQGQTTGADDMPTETVSLNYAQGPSLYHTVKVDAPSALDGMIVCAMDSNGLIHCTSAAPSGQGGLVVERLPDTHMFEQEHDPETGETRSLATLEWDEPAQVMVGGFAGKTVRLRIATVNNAPGLVKVGGGTVVFSAANTPMMSLSLERGCRADLTATAVTGQAGYGVPDGVLDNDDFFYYLAQFAAGNVAAADMTAGAVPGVAGYGQPDGVISNDDFFYYLAIFAAGC